MLCLVPRNWSLFCFYFSIFQLNLVWNHQLCLYSDPQDSKSQSHQLTGMECFLCNQMVAMKEGIKKMFHEYSVFYKNKYGSGCPTFPQYQFSFGKWGEVG
ncbi:unnamed protein product [Rangifer tarandus platyrhynchus]|uniref:Uncharacterized protein n=1 Tax=Rangifer tarandus platyrhynchus TaxID=3082113 RepID=A0ABN9A8I2_RANTA|nr:unnamed protein product [Rangifer tarandus platyrhynchus]